MSRNGKTFSEHVRCLILVDHLSGMKNREIAKKYDCSQSYPILLARRSGISPETPQQRRRSDSALIAHAIARGPHRDWLILWSDTPCQTET